MNYSLSMGLQGTKNTNQKIYFIKTRNFSLLKIS